MDEQEEVELVAILVRLSERQVRQVLEMIRLVSEEARARDGLQPVDPPRRGPS